MTQVLFCRRIFPQTKPRNSAYRDIESKYREIDSNIFVWVGTSTQYKIDTLKKVFQLFEIDPSELVFHLKCT
jgi:hypothetical protein